MKKVKLIIILLLIATVLLLTFAYTATGTERTDVFVEDFSLSDDGSELHVDVMVSGSMGYTKNMKVKQGGDNKYITFTSTWLNNSIGAKSSYVIDLNKTCEEIYFYSGDGGYRLVLSKNRETGVWEKVNENTN